MFVCEICGRERQGRSPHSEVNDWCIPCGIDEVVKRTVRAVRCQVSRYKAMGLSGNPYAKEGKESLDVLALGKYLLFEEGI